MLEANAKYSIVIPAYNSETTISRCIQSILNSEFNEKFELIVVDDASQDNTQDIVSNLGAKVIKNSKCGGPSQARNLGARYAEGEILVFVDSDVILFPDSLKKIDVFFKNEKEFSAISANFISKCEMTDSISRYKHLYMCYSLLNQPKSVSWTFTSTFAIKKDVFEIVGRFNEKVQVNEDDLLGRELVKKGYKIGFGKQIFIEHLHKYTLCNFVREEFKRSRTLILMKYAAFFKKAKSLTDNISGNMIWSLLLLPFLIVGFFLSNVNWLFFILPLIIFYSVNFGFLRYCKKAFGVKLMLQSVFIIPLDCLICYVGIVVGFFDFLRGKRI